MKRSDAVALAVAAGLDGTVHASGQKTSAERVIDTLVALGVLLLDDPPAVEPLLPPEEYQRFTFHWLEGTDDQGVARQMPAQCLGNLWNIAGLRVDATEMTASGRWRYVAPCPMPEETP